MNYTIFFLSSFLLCLTQTIFTQKEPTPIRRESPHTITLFMHPIDITDLNHEQAKLTELLERPGKITRAILKEKFKNDTQRGVYVLYAGFVDVLNANGQVRFPRKHQDDEITYIVIRKIEPVILRGNTVEFFVRDKNEPVAYYTVQRHHDKHNNVYYWETKKIATPQNKKIPPAAIVIFAKPHQIYIPEGKTIAMKGPNLLLPPLYPTRKLTHDFNAALNALSFLKISKYYARIQDKTERTGKIYRQIMLP